MLPTLPDVVGILLETYAEVDSRPVGIVSLFGPSRTEQRIGLASRNYRDISFTAQCSTTSDLNAAREWIESRGVTLEAWTFTEPVNGDMRTVRFAGPVSWGVHVRTNEDGTDGLVWRSQFRLIEVPA